MRAALTDESTRIRFQFLCVYASLTLAAAAMTLLNLFTWRGSLLWVTLGFTVLCGAMFFLTRRRLVTLDFTECIFVIAVIAMFVYFITSGNPEGFSVLWICLMPSLGPLLFGRRRGSLICLAMFVLILFFFQTDMGTFFLHYPYTASFRMRFPILFCVFYLLGLLLETIRYYTHQELLDAQRRYRYLYSHDALTHLYNRHGFNELMDDLFAGDTGGLSLLIIDLDLFKRVNDSFGHLQGDSVLAQSAALIASTVGTVGHVCRWGGEEFAVLLGPGSDPAALAQRLCQSFRSAEMQVRDGVVHLTVSIGSARLLKSDFTASHLVNAADTCLYRAKSLGRDRAEHTDL